MADRLIYLDANVFIYAIEGDGEIAGQLFDLFRTRRAIGVTSELTLAEVLAGATDLRRRMYLDLLVWSRIFGLQPVTRDARIETAEYRKHSGIAKIAGCHSRRNGYPRRLSVHFVSRHKAPTAGWLFPDLAQSR